MDEDRFSLINEKIRKEIEGLIGDKRFDGICKIIHESMKHVDAEEFGDYALFLEARRIVGKKEIVEPLAEIATARKLDGSFSGVALGVIPPLKKRIERKRR